MVAILGIYENGRVTFDQDANIPSKARVIVTFLEENESPSTKKVLRFSSFSFSKTRSLLKNVKSSFSDTVIEERRNAL